MAAYSFIGQLSRDVRWDNLGEKPTFLGFLYFSPSSDFKGITRLFVIFLIFYLFASGIFFSRQKAKATCSQRLFLSFVKTQTHFIKH